MQAHATARQSTPMAQHIAAMQLRFGPAAWRVVEQAGCLHRLSSWRSFASVSVAQVILLMHAPQPAPMH